MSAHYNPDAEVQVLGGLLLDPTRWHDVHVKLKATDFYMPRHEKIYESLERMDELGQEFSLVTLTDQLRRTNLLDEVGGVAYLIGLEESVENSAWIMQHVDTVRDHAALRELVSMSEKIVSDADQGVRAVELLPEVESRVAELSQQYVSESRSPKEYAELALGIFDGSGYIPTGIQKLDHVIGGIPVGITFLGARPSMGKSALMRDIARFAEKHGFKSAIFSYDQSGAAIYRLEASRISGVPLTKIKAGAYTKDEKQAWQRALQALTRRYVYVDDRTYALDQLCSKIRSLAKQGTKLFCIDYIQQVRIPGSSVENTVQVVGKVSMTLKALALELDVAILALSQLSRNIEHRKDKKPVLADLRESGQIEQDADVVLLLYREAYYSTRDMGVPEPPSSLADIIIAKNKEGGTGSVQVRFMGETTTFKPKELI